jgi:hypothetical protein
MHRTSVPLSNHDNHTRPQPPLPHNADYNYPDSLPNSLSKGMCNVHLDRNGKVILSSNHKTNYLDAYGHY